MNSQSEHQEYTNAEGILQRAIETAKNSPIPIIRQINALAHKDAIRLGLGELPYEPDKKVVEILSNPKPEHFKYAPNAGIIPLRKAVASKYGKEFDENNVLITIGVQEAMFTTLMTLKKLGAKKVLIPEINFGIYKSIPAELGLEIATFKLTDDFGVDLQDLDIKLQEQKPDIVILNSPGNPTGRVYDNTESAQISMTLSTYGKPILISDEIYNTLTFEKGRWRSMNEIYKNSIIVDGISKSGAGAGLRVGWVFSRNKELISCFTGTSTKIKSSGPTNNQYAAVPVVDGSADETINGYREKLLSNYNILEKELRSLDNIKFIPSQGGFYSFPDVSYYAGSDSDEFCRYVAQLADGVVVIPGKAFGKPGNIRISFASNQIEEGLKRLKLHLVKFKTKKQTETI